MSDYRSDEAYSQQLAARLVEFVHPLLERLDKQVDKRLVRTFLLTLQAIITFRHSQYGLLLSELGAYVLSPGQAPAGTKRVSNLLRSKKWKAQEIETYLWEQADARLTAHQDEDKPPLVVWDESVVEKAETLASEDLGAVRSRRAALLKRVRPGFFFNPPGGRPVLVPGMEWLTLLLLLPELPPLVATRRWWTTRGPHASCRQDEQEALLEHCVGLWGRRVIHVWDRGFASRLWLEQVLRHKVRFILRWPKRYNLLNAQGLKVNAWKVTRGKRSMDSRLIWDARRRCWRKTGLIFAPVRHPAHEAPLWLVVARPGKGREPWYLLTNEPLATVEDAWRIVLAYARRWQVEMTYRYAKTELAIQSPRLWFWHNRLKFMMMVALVYAFLLSLILPDAIPLRETLLRRWCHRTGKRYRTAAIPLYRLRSALSRLWLAYPPDPLRLWETPG